MLTSLALIFLVGLGMGWLAARLRLPRLLGMLITGILLGPYVLGLLDPSILSISADLRQLALIIILTRAGLNLDLRDLPQVGRPAVLLCFVPACFEMAGSILLAPRFFGISTIEAAVLGSVLAAVSPAVIVPSMLRLMDEHYGTDHSIPQMILAGAAVDDIFVIVAFTAFCGLAQGTGGSAAALLQVPVSIVTGALAGAAIGYLFASFYKKVHVRDSVKVVVLLSIAFLLVALENALKGSFPFSGLLAVMSCGLLIGRQRPQVAARLSAKFAKLWVGAEALLFVLVGAAVDIRYAKAAGLTAVALIACALMFRMVGVWICMLKTSLSGKERLFCMIAYTPKATVQAAIGSVPLSLGLSCGNLVLTVAVAAILITAPLGAFGVEMTYKKLLNGVETA